MTLARRDRRSRQRPQPLVLTVALLTLSGYGGTPERGPDLPADGVAAAVPAASSGTVTDADVDAPAAPAAPAAVAAVAAPVRIEVPAIRVDAEVIPLGVTERGELEVPEDGAQTGYWTGGALPGEAGPAVIAGHIDSSAGPAVFYALRDLEAGDRIIVRREDGSAVSFSVSRLAFHDKDAFPTADVYGHTDAPTLRLITCGGSFDHDTGHYRSNLIVYAEPMP